MRLEDYLDFVETDVIRLKGRRIGLEHIVERYLAGDSPELIAASFHDLSLEQVYGVITYYLHHKPEVDAYLEHLNQYVEDQIRDVDAHQSPAALRLRVMKRERERSPA